MLEKYEETVRPILNKLHEYKEKIVLVISKFDECSSLDKNQAKQMIT